MYVVFAGRFFLIPLQNRDSTQLFVIALHRFMAIELDRDNDGVVSDFVKTRKIGNIPAVFK